MVQKSINPQNDTRKTHYREFYLILPTSQDKKILMSSGQEQLSLLKHCCEADIVVEDDSYVRVANEIRREDTALLLTSVK